jgi:HK97 family phage portal protein
MGLFSRQKSTDMPASRDEHLPNRSGSVYAKSAQFTPEAIQMVRTHGLGVSSYGAMYRRQPAVRAVVDWIARNIAQLNPKVYERVADTERVENSSHPLAVILRNPNPSTTRYSHLRDTVADLAVFDLAYWVKDRPQFPRSVTRLAPSQVQVEKVEDRWVYRGPDGTEIPRNRLVIFHGYNPDGAGTGVSPLETLRRVLQEEMAAQQHRENFWRNAGRQNGVIERPIEAPAWDDAAFDRFRATWEAATTGAGNAGRTAILEDGMTWNPASFSPKDSDYIAGRKLTYEEVAIQYGLLDVGAQAGSKANQEQSHRERYQDVLGPWLRMLQDEIELQLLPAFEPMSRPGRVYVEFNLAEKLKGSFEEQQKSLTTAVGVPHMSVNEGRARVNLPRIDEAWADTPVQPLNVMYGGQPAVTVPTDVPGTASADPQMKARVAAEENVRNEAASAFETLLSAYFDRQERSVTSAFAGKSVSATDRTRWDRELAANLYTQSALTAASQGRRTAVQLRGVYDEGRTRNWLLANAERTAEQVNANTFAAVDAAEDLDGVRRVFDTAKTSQAKTLGLSLATTLVAFGRTEAGRHTADSQGRRVVKTWRVTSGNSRHPEMNGETVGVDETFSNGARWPGDPSLGADGAAGCNCVLDIGAE